MVKPFANQWTVRKVKKYYCETYETRLLMKIKLLLLFNVNQTAGLILFL